MPRQARKLKSAKVFGADIRQLARLTGVSIGLIQNMKNDHENRPHDSLIYVKV
jgi:hypothetical protein